MGGIFKKLESLKKNLKNDNSRKIIMADIFDARNDLENAIRNFNETTQSEYIDIAILNLNLAKKKYELKLKEAGEYMRENKAI